MIGRAEPPTATRRRRRPQLPFLEIAQRLEPGFGAGHLVLGHEVPALVDASPERQGGPGRLRGRARVAQRAAPGRGRRPAARARARRRPARPPTLVERIYRPLQAHSHRPVATLWCYLDNGRSLEATARELFVHPNTVRYRLKRVTEVIGWDATGPREALILQTALILGSIGTDVDPPTAVGGTPRPRADLCDSHKAISAILVTRSPDGHRDRLAGLDK